MKPKGKSARGKVDEAAPAPNDKWEGAYQAYVIRFPNRQARVRAIEVFLDVPIARQSYPGGLMVVRRGHIDALKQAGIPFEDLTGTPTNHGKKKSKETTPLPPERP
jgi:hypothetical protein